ncbi:ATP-binding protein [Rapidithrix thailandica]|uniref:histidine kinase n=1 Tax=Rapidithrix thailandica TaxID=413964 RepID=A0AAW9S6E2_9BACT
MNLKAWIFLLFLLSYLSVTGQIKNKGIPLLEVYTSQEYAASAQNRDILQDHRGLMYFANGEGVLEFDGNQWQLIEIANKAPVSSLGIDSSGYIYVGAQAELGFLAPDSSGQLLFHSLIDKLPIEQQGFESIVATNTLKDQVFFLSRRQLFVYQNATFTIFNSKTEYTQSALIEGVYYLIERGKGLMKYQTGKICKVPGGEFFADKHVEALLPFEGHTQILIYIKEEGFYLLDTQTGQRQVFITGVDNLLKNTRITCAKKITSPFFNNTFYAIGTQRKGLLIVDRTGKPIQHINHSKGLPTNQVLAMEMDETGNLWLGLDNGIVIATISSPFSVFQTVGLPLSISHSNDTLYTGTTQGIYSIPWQHYQNPVKLHSQFQLLPSSKEQCWFTGEFNRHMLFAHTEGLYALRNGKIRKITSEEVRNIIPFKNDSTKLLACTHHHGIGVLSLENGEWQLTQMIESLNVCGKYVAIDTQNQIWVTHPFKGIYKVQLDSSLSQARTVDFYDTTYGLPSHLGNYVFDLGNEVVFGTNKGIYQYNADLNGFEPHSGFSGFVDFTQPVKHLAKDPYGNYWFQNGNEIKTAYLQEDGTYQVKSQIFNKIQGIELFSIYPIDNRNVFFASAKGLIHYDPMVGETQNLYVKPAFNTFIRKIRLADNDSVLFAGTTLSPEGKLTGHPPGTKKLRLPYSQNRLHLEVAATWYEKPKDILYQYRLDGLDQGWSNWTQQTEREFVNLSPGKYTFHVQAKNSVGTIGKTASFSFSILPPWYLTKLAMLLYFLLSAFCLWAIIQWRIRKHLKEKIKLESLVKERTSKVLEQKKEIETQKESITEQNAKLLALNQEKNHLIGILAHDMRNPLHQIKMITAVLQKDYEEGKKDFGIITNAVNYIDSMISKILDLEAIESQQPNLQRTEVDLARILQECIHNLTSNVRQKQLQWQTANLEPGRFIARLDNQYTYQVFENLLSNAIKFSPYGKNIYLRIFHQSSKIIVEIKDEGPGIKPEEQKYLFKKFQKLSAQPTGGEQSIGLGLSIVKKYVKAMQGEVTCHSKEGEGATFRVAFKEA